MELELLSPSQKSSSPIITLFLYGIGALRNCKNTYSSYILHYSYMELELYKTFSIDLDNLYYIIPIWNWSYLYAVLDPYIFDNYIIPIWNWSDLYLQCNAMYITYYIIPIWNWSIQSGKEKLAPVATLHYSYMELEQKLYGLSNQIYPLLHYSYMELEQKNVASPVCPDTVSITLFLYGIGAEMKSIQPTSHVLITLFLYGIGAVVTWCVVAFINHITLFLYGIGAVVRSPF